MPEVSAKRSNVVGVTSLTGLNTVIALGGPSIEAWKLLRVPEAMWLDAGEPERAALVRLCEEVGLTLDIDSKPERPEWT